MKNLILSLFSFPLYAQFIYNNSTTIVTFTDNTTLKVDDILINTSEIDSISYYRKEMKAFMPKSEYKGDNWFLQEEIAAFLPQKMQKKAFVYYYKHKNSTDYLYKTDPTDYLFIQEKDTITAFVLPKNEKTIKKVQGHFIKAQVLVFKIFVKEKIYHKIIIEKLKEDKKK